LYHDVRVCHAGPLRVDMCDLEAAQEGFQPSASWGVGTAAPSGSGPRGWEDVGGAAAAREALKEALELPARFAKLIAKYEHHMGSFVS
jgi:SpoVK/Ycf46/Vps4 family AAA+-type ATPase